MEKPKLKDLVAATYLFPNGNIATFNYKGEQVVELQGVYTKELHDKISRYSDEKTDWNGFTPSAPTQQTEL